MKSMEHAIHRETLWILCIFVLMGAAMFFLGIPISKNIAPLLVTRPLAVNLKCITLTQALNQSDWGFEATTKWNPHPGASAERPQ